ncbi:probable disease resistance protein At4g27220 isoform X3 [Populus nigra]|uniref:probable disease resistance protein At4g27220 isoform X3 n=1 Tax=Populus nigra TaxID=3691 RepID=UPI002B27510E|nr:probable disease resistance protein At4g27220 isoform X3 [Populus nigra]
MIAGRSVPKHVQEAAFLATEGANKKLKIRGNWSTEDDDDVDIKTEEALVEIVAEASSFGGLTLNKRDAREDALPIRELVGQAFEENKKTIWSWLMNDEVFCIGIYGMGGVGKTSLVKHIYYQLRRKSDTFHRVHWIAVSQDFSIYKLQNRIAKCLGLHLSNEDSEMQRAQELSEALGTKRPHFLILDDLWDTFDPEKVGIPIQEDGCKLIITTRSLKVCRGMGCIHKIKVEPLTCDEAWTLFMEKLKHDVELSPEVEQIAKSVTKECAGLPLGIITMAGSMRGVDDLHEWRNTLEKLKESKVRDMEDEGFRLLRFSYDRLNDLALQQCFLYCALFPEGISRDDLIGYLIDEGIIDGIKSRQAEFDEGHTMLNELENVCLLESCDDHNGCRGVRMHDLIRSMTHQIQLMNCPIMVGEELRDVDKWKEDLVRVSWTSGKLKEISPSHSPRCPNLSTLLLPCNDALKFIADSFFKQLNRLKILDLSRTNIEVLPDSVSDLVSLRALLLKGCKQLRHVPSLKKLRLLKRLDLSDTVLENVPQDMEYLSNLRYLKLNGCRQKEFPTGILPKLYSLQVFVLDDDWVNGQYAPVTVEGKEVACLRKLETLKCHFELFSDFVGYLKSWDETLSLSTYKFLVGQCNNDDVAFLEFSGRSKIVWLCNFNNRSCLEFPTDIQELVILKSIDAKSLCDVLSPQYTTELEYIEIVLCDRMESLLSSSWFCSTPLPFPSNDIFSHLKDFYCYGCTSMKKLFPLVLLPNLLNLEMISVERCGKMEEIIETRVDWVMGEESSSSCRSIEFSLPKLRHLSFILLPELKSICRENLICSSLQTIIVRDCPKLKRMPLCLPVLDNGRPSPPPSLEEIYVDPKEWWESVEWDHPNSKDALLPFLVLGAGARLLEEEGDEEDVEDNDEKRF